VSERPSRWTTASLFDICNPKQWPTISQTAFVEEGYPVYGANGQIGYYSEFNHEKATVLITCRGATCGTINVCVPKSYVTGNAMALDDLDETKVRTEYLVYALRSGSLAQAISGTAQPQITRQSLTAISIPLPPLAEQRRIAEVLDRAEALRAKRRAALAQLDALTQSLFLDLFGDPAANPKDWPIRVIGDLLESACYGTSEKSGGTGEFPVLRMNNIARTGEMDYTDLKFMDLPAKLHDRFLVRDGDVLFNRTNSADLVGKTGIFRGSKPMAYAGYLIRLRVTDENDPEYLSRFLNSGYSKRMLRGMCKSIIGMANINATEVQAMKIPQPPLPLQREFAGRVTGVEKLKAAQRAALTELDALFAALQHRAFRGEL
jgi:type I restriction enzyme S subunit